MSLRSLVLRLVATPDRAWLTLLAGTLLIARECVAPGRIAPGLTGAILLLTGAWYLPATVPGLLVSGVLLIIQARHRAWYLPSVAAATTATIFARSAGCSWPAALASLLVIAILTVLIRIAVLARRRKFSADLT